MQHKALTSWGLGLVLAGSACWRTSEEKIATQDSGVAARSAYKTCLRVMYGGAPIKGATVSLIHPEPEAPLLSAISNEKGISCFAELERGVYKVEVIADQFMPLSERKIHVPLPTVLTLPLQRGEQIVGKVLDNDQKPIAAAEVSIARVELPRQKFVGVAGNRMREFTENLGIVPGPVPAIPKQLPKKPPLRGAAPKLWQATSDASGQFTIVGVPPGTYRVVSRHAHKGSATSRPVQVTANGPEATVTLVVGTAPPPRSLSYRHPRRGGAIKIASERGIDVSGRVVDRQTGAAIRGVTIGVAGTDAGTFRNGEFTLNLPPGPTTLVFSAPMYAERRIDLDVPAPDERAFPITLDVELAHAGTIRGNLFHSNGDSIGKAQVRCGQATTWSNDRGQFELKNVAEGTWSLHVRTEMRQEFVSDPVTVVGGETVGPLSIYLR